MTIQIFKEWKQEGIEEAKKEIAIKMKNLNMDIKTIIETTELTKEKIDEL